MSLEKVGLTLTEAEKTAEIQGREVRVRRTEGSVTDWSVNSTAYHEACHTVAALLLGITVHKATDVPSAEYGGATWVDRYDPLVTAAAEARGCDGTGHDMWTIAAMGDSPSSAVSGARALLSGQDSALKAVATAIQRAGTASGTELAHAQTRTERDRVEVEIETSRGTRTEHAELRNGEVYIDIPVERSNV